MPLHNVSFILQFVFQFIHPPFKVGYTLVSLYFRPVLKYPDEQTNESPKNQPFRPCYDCSNDRSNHRNKEEIASRMHRITFIAKIIIYAGLEVVYLCYDFAQSNYPAGVSKFLDDVQTSN